MTAQQLKNSILQMAVQGKLVPQAPNDEPASVLLERIRAEKERLIKDVYKRQVLHIGIYSPKHEFFLHKFENFLVFQQNW